MLMKISLDQQDKERHPKSFTNSINNFTQNSNSNIKIKETNTLYTLPPCIRSTISQLLQDKLSTTNWHGIIYPFILRFRELLQNVYQTMKQITATSAKGIYRRNYKISFYLFNILLPFPNINCSLKII